MLQQTEKQFQLNYRGRKKADIQTYVKKNTISSLNIYFKASLCSI